MPTRVAVDAMGGDHAPGAVVDGVARALVTTPDLEVTLVEDGSLIERELVAANPGGNGARLHIIHASKVIPLDASPIEILRTHRDSSLGRMAELGAAGEVDAMVSAGNTGAVSHNGPRGRTGRLCVRGEVRERI